MASALDLWVRPDEQCVALAGDDFRLLQRRRGHRYSVDDMLVAHLAATSVDQEPRRALDLGCGLGSVLLLLAWRFSEATLVGVEAQPEHVALARRNLLLNGCERRATILAGDLREATLIEGLDAPFDLVTATPPYFDPRRGTLCQDPQRAAAQWELRGGIEDYALAAAKALTPEGLLVACAAAEPKGRAVAALAAAGLSLRSSRPVHPRRDKPPFLLLLTATPGPASSAREEAPLVLREAEGERTCEHRDIRRWTGLPAGPR